MPADPKGFTVYLTTGRRNRKTLRARGFVTAVTPKSVSIMLAPGGKGTRGEAFKVLGRRRRGWASALAQEMYR